MHFHYIAIVHFFMLLWQPNYCLQAYTTHNSPVMSLDFHPKKTELFCFCDHDNEILYWSINSFSCVRASKVGCFPFQYEVHCLHLYKLVISIYNFIFIAWSREVLHRFDFNLELEIYWLQHQIK